MIPKECQKNLLYFYPLIFFMDLIIDAGNTAVKIAVFSKGELLEKKVSFPENLFQDLENVLDQYPQLEKGILSNVTVVEDAVLSKIQAEVSLLILDNNTKVPFIKTYKTPNTLGKDRIALVSAAVSSYPTKSVLVIDAGSCITYDLKNASQEHLGGAISPGLAMRYRSLHAFTTNLPLLEYHPPKDLIGSSTEESMHSGVVHGVINEIDGVIDNYNAVYQDLTVILTGGDAPVLAKSLKNSIFADSNFLLKGLYCILEINQNR